MARKKKDPSEKKIGLWDIVQEVQSGKRNFIAADPTVKYPAFMVNRALSQQIDTVMWAQFMNMMPELPGEMQMEFLLSVVPKKRRFGKWAKKELDYDPADVENVKTFYQVNERRALKILQRLDEKQIGVIDHVVNFKGGVKK